MLISLLLFAQKPKLFLMNADILMNNQSAIF